MQKDQVRSVLLSLYIPVLIKFFFAIVATLVFWFYPNFSNDLFSTNVLLKDVMVGLAVSSMVVATLGYWVYAAPRMVARCDPSILYGWIQLNRGCELLLFLLSVLIALAVCYLPIKVHSILLYLFLLSNVFLCGGVLLKASQFIYYSGLVYIFWRYDQYMPFLMVTMLFWSLSRPSFKMTYKHTLFMLIFPASVFVLYWYLFGTLKMVERFSEQLAPSTWNYGNTFHVYYLLEDILPGMPPHRIGLAEEGSWGPQFQVAYFLFSEYIDATFILFFAICFIIYLLISYLALIFLLNRLIFSFLTSFSLLLGISPILTELNIDFGMAMYVFIVLAAYENFLLLKKRKKVYMDKAI